MEWSANRLIPAILGGGVALGLLASTAVNTRPKSPPQPDWRVAAREAAYKPSNLAYVDHGPIDLSPNLPWIGTGPDGSVAPMAEDFYRGRIIPIRAEDYKAPESVYDPPAFEADEELNERPVNIHDQVDQPAAHPHVADVSDEPRFKLEGPRIWDEPEGETEESDLGG